MFTAICNGLFGVKTSSQKAYEVKRTAEIKREIFTLERSILEIQRQYERDYREFHEKNGYVNESIITDGQLEVTKCDDRIFELRKELNGLPYSHIN